MVYPLKMVFTMIYHDKLGCLWILAKKTWISLARMDKNCELLTKTMIIPTKRGIQRLKQQTKRGLIHGDSISNSTELDDMSQPLKIGMEIGLNLI